MKHALQHLIQNKHLTEAEAEAAMTLIMDGGATDAQIAAFAVALRMKGETAAEVAGLARAMRRFAVSVPVHTSKTLVDTCGTGGDGHHTFNISTAAALIVAADGTLAVAKHGNRASSSKCGSADVLEALGVRLDLPPADVARCVEEIGIGFLFAPAMHPSFRVAAGPRREMGVRTVFNLLGPLSNPAGATHQLIGVSEPRFCELLAHVLLLLGSERALLVHGADGLDEVSTTSVTYVSELKNGAVQSYVLDAQAELNIPRCAPSDLAGGDDAHENADILCRVLDGTDTGPKRDIVLLNAAGVFLAAGVADTWADGLTRATELLNSGAAWETLRRLREFA